MLFRRILLLSSVVVCAACRDAARPATPEQSARPAALAHAALDDFGDSVLAGARAERIVSLNPVATEILFALGAGPRVVGRTHWDLYPSAAGNAADVGNGMQPNVEAVLAVHPDLVVLYGSPSNRAAAAQLRRAGVVTISIRTDRVADFRRAVEWLSRAVGDTAAGRFLADSVERSLEAVRSLPRPARAPTVFWHVWDTPLMTIGKGSYLSELVAAAGATNVFADMEAPSPQVTMEEVVRRDPDFILAGPVNAAKIRASAAWRAVPAVRNGRVLVVDTALVGRPGVRLAEAARHLRALIAGGAPR